MEGMTIWRLTAHHEDTESAIAWMRANERIAIGWNYVGDVRGYSSKKEIEAVIQDTCRASGERSNASSGSNSLWDLCHTMRTGDLVIVAQKLVVQVEGAYEFAEDDSQPEEEYQHQRRVSLTRLNPDAIWKAAGRMKEHNVSQALVQCVQPLSLDDVIALAQPA